MEEKFWFFEQVNLYKILCPHRYREFKKHHRSREYGKEDYIYFEDDNADKIYLVENGKVKIGKYDEEGNEFINSILIKGDLFGEKAILGEERRQEFAQAMDHNTTICMLSVDDMRELIIENKSMSLYIYKIIGFRIKKLERRLQLMLFKDARSRLIALLRELKEEYGKTHKFSEDTVILHPYNQSEMASLIGLRRPTLNSLMNQLKQEGLIEFSRKEIILRKKSQNVI